MAYKSISFASVDLRDGVAREIYITNKEVLVKPATKKGEQETIPKFYGYDKIEGPVSFLATDKLEQDLDKCGDIPFLCRVQWKGKIELKDGRSFNVFTVEQWEGPIPSWCTEGKAEKEEDFPDPF